MRRSDFVIRRVVFALVTIFVALSMNFVLFRAAPGDAVAALRCTQCSAEFRASQREALGLDKPLIAQYGVYLRGLLHGDMGSSLRTEQPVTSEIWTPLKNTVPMVALGVALALVLGVATGLLAAWRRGTAVDRASTWSALTLNSLPPQWLGLLMVLFAAGWFGLPSSGLDDPTLDVLGDASTWEVVADRIEHMLLPSLTLALVIYGSFTLVVRSALLETLGEDYVLTARAKGLSNWRVISRHAFRNALLPLVTAGALMLGLVVGGTITIEYVFSYPGIGLRAVEAIDQRDWPVLEGVFLVVTTTVIVANLLVDLLHLKLDPRVTA